MAVRKREPRIHVLYKVDIAVMFRKSVRTIDRWAQSGRLPPALGVPGPMCWSADVFMAWLHSSAGRRLY